MRRICDILASSPWLIKQYRPAGFYKTSTNVCKDENIRQAEHLLHNRTTVVFADEIANELRMSRDVVYAAWTKTPGVMPPFKNILVEARTGADSVGHDFVGTAAHGQFVDHDVLEVLARTSGAIAESYRSTLESIDKIYKDIPDIRKQNVRGALFIYVWLQRHDGTVWGPVGELFVLIGRDFRVMMYEGGEDWLDKMHRPADKPTVGMPIVVCRPLCLIPDYVDKDAGFIADAIHLAGAMFIRTIGLMNASNVKCVEEGYTNNHITPKQRDKQRLAWVKYHVLKLQVGTKLKPLSQPRGTERTMALHMVRGHFKDFSARGLFGKYKGQEYSHVWCPAFVQGKREDGVVVRDYEQETVSEDSERKSDGASREGSSES